MDPIVSISCLTYNHAKYIRAAMDGFLKQKTRVSYEILIHDDASTDATSGFIKEYAREYPDIIYPIIRNENQYQKGLRGMSLTFNVPRARGKYIALCEGDDFWTDPLKLQKQVDFLEAHSDVAGCFHNARVVNENGELMQEEWFDAAKQAACGNRTRFTQEDCLTKLKHAYPTCSFVFRKAAVEIIPEWVKKIPSGDFALDMLVSQHGDLVYIPENMAAYRIHSGGMWQGASDITRKKFGYTTHLVLLQVPEFRRKYGFFLRSVLRKSTQLLVRLYRSEGNYVHALKYYVIHLYYKVIVKLERGLHAFSAH